MLIYENESFVIRGAIFEVYYQLGAGFLEAVYQECLEKEFLVRNIPFVSQPQLDLYYKDEKLNQFYKPDFVCFDSIILELKALSKVSNEHQAQVLNYLKAGQMKLGLLVNFGSFPKVTIDRFVL
ncbi:MAG: GxxExxY protein [Desulfuromusa sp.]|nr:GxxExxY protein [Desulfuromusa sp.]